MELENITEYLIDEVGLSPRHKGTMQLAEALQIVIDDRTVLYSMFLRVCEPLAQKYNVNPKSIHKNFVKVLQDSKVDNTPTEFLLRESIKYKKYMSRQVDIKHGDKEK